MLDPRDPPEAPLFDDRDRALYGAASPLLNPLDPGLTDFDAKRRWEEETLPAAIAAGTIERRADGSLAYTTAPDTAGGSIAADAPFHAQASKME